MKIVNTIERIAVSIGVLIVAYGAFIVLSLSGVFLPNPRMPEIKYAEFPLRIEIECNGERFVFEDAIVCEYAGVGVSDFGSSKHRRWKERLASGKDYQASYPTIILLDTDDVEIKYHSGEGAYYMDKPYYEIDDSGQFYKDNDGTPYSPSRPKIYVYDKHGGIPGESSLSFTFIDTTPQQEPKHREILAKYGVEIISMEQTPPIENKFR